ncbi:hypothetical protein C8F04DRAFT_1231874 [Mycena alexandri]|uniref:Uncharacterized protein n=1 Tax=Mycena alexandri TaxID=1745969 RepID=A0AAD6X7X8_9AGAR|nr:hypothetical protein C8F04DRAFT_1231874 [Mycena alexandri]
MTTFGCLRNRALFALYALCRKRRIGAVRSGRGSPLPLGSEEMESVGGRRSTVDSGARQVDEGGEDASSDVAVCDLSHECRFGTDFETGARKSFQVVWTTSSPTGPRSSPPYKRFKSSPSLLNTAVVKGFNNVQPRTNVGRVAADAKIPPAVAARIERMEGAHMNGNENFPLWAAAVLAGNFAGLDNRTMNIISIVYFCGRVLYNYVYITQETRRQSSIRTTIFFSNLCLPLYLLIAAATKLARK